MVTDNDFTEELRLCGEFWVWLYGYRKEHDREPTGQQKMAHPSFVALRELRVRVYGDVYPAEKAPKKRARVKRAVEDTKETA